MSLIFAFYVGLIPTVSMLAVSILSMILKDNHVSLVSSSFSEKFNDDFESGMQLFSAGLIISVVAIEFFPMMLDSDCDFIVQNASIIGGFTFALIFLYGINALVESGCQCFKIQHFAKSYYSSVETHEEKPSSSKLLLSHDAGKSYGAIEELEACSSDGLESKLSITSDEGGGDASEKSEIASSIGGDWEESAVEFSVQALADPKHRTHIHEHLVEIKEAIYSIDSKIKRFLHDQDNTHTHNHASNHVILAMKTVNEAQLAEEIDMETHNLQYKLDHCRRLLQGSEAELQGRLAPMHVLMDPEHRSQAATLMRSLKKLSNHIIFHVEDETFSSEDIKEIHGHIDHMDKLITKFHHRIEVFTRKWKRHRLRDQDDLLSPGSVIPVSLMLPVLIDAVIDGSLIGISTSLSRQAGLVLGLANGLEMGALGLAVSVRINKCTGSSITLRYLALIVPPVAMLAATVCSSMLTGTASHANPAMSLFFVAFGVVALLCLACNELLWEARSLLGGENYFSSAMFFFAGIYAIILCDQLTATE